MNSQQTTKLRIGVLMGGISLEREVSFNSGRTICDHLDTERFIPIPIFQTQTRNLYILPERFVHRGKTTDFEHRLAQEAESVTWDDLPQRIDFAFIAMHGRWVEDGCLQGMLELLNIPYFGGKVLASALGMNKIAHNSWLKAAGINVPQQTVLRAKFLADLATATTSAREELKKMGASYTYPVIVKPAHEGSSFGVTKVACAAELLDAVLTAATITPGLVQPVLVEECIQGMEFTCIVISDIATGKPLPLPPTEIIPEKDIFTYEEKYMPGRAHKHTPARCTPEQTRLIQDAAVATMQALGCATFARIDGFLTTDNRVVIIDPNTLGGMAPSSFTFLQAAEIGMSHTMLINHLLDAELVTAGVTTSPTGATDTMEPSPQKLRVAVIMGGASAEREISLESGRNITYKLSPHKYEALPLFLTQDLQLFKLDQKLLVKNSTQEISDHLNPADRILWSDLPRIADFVFIGLHGGHGENGSLQGALELLGLPYNGSSVMASALCMDKYKTVKFLRQQGFSVPRGALIEAAAWYPACDVEALIAQHAITFPCIIKPHDDGCSTLVHKADNATALAEALEAIYTTGRTAALVEEYIVGMELTVGVIGNETPQALPPSYSVATGGILSLEEKFLPGAGENQTPAPLPAPVIALVQEELCRAYSTLQCRGYVRIDCFYQTAAQSPTGSERLVILEVNTLPALTPATCIFHQAAEIGIKPMEFIDMIIELGRAAHQPVTSAQTKSTPAHTSVAL